MKKNHIIYNNSLDYLQNNLSDDLYAEDFTEEQSLQLMSNLLQISSEEDILSAKEHIREAFLEYFKAHYYEIIVNFKPNNTIYLKVKESEEESEHTRVIQKVSTSIIEESKNIEKCWTQKNVLIVSKDIMKSLHVHTDSIENKKKRELIKKSFRHSLKLSPRDIVFCMDKRIVVVKFISREERNRLCGTKEKIKKEQICNTRFAGLPPEEMTKLKTKYFSDNIWNQVEPALEDLMDKKLDFAHISNEYFSKNFIKFLQSIFKKIVLVATEIEEIEVVNVLTNFLLREYFDKILRFMARRLTRQASMREGDAEAFIRYYNGETVLSLSGKPMIKPLIMDSENNNWNALTIMSITIQYTQQLNMIKTQEDQLKPYEKALTMHNDEYQKLELQKKQINNEKDEFEKGAKEFLLESRDKKNELGVLKKQLGAMGKEVSSDILKEVNSLSVEYKNSFKREEEIFHQRKAIEKKTGALNVRINNHKTERKLIIKKLDAAKNKIKALYDEFEPMELKYEIAVSALAKTIILKPTSFKN